MEGGGDSRMRAPSAVTCRIRRQLKRRMAREVEMRRRGRAGEWRVVRVWFRRGAVRVERELGEEEKWSERVKSSSMR